MAPSLKRSISPPPLLIYFTNLLMHRKQSVMCQEKPFLWPGWWRSAELWIEHLQTVDIKKMETRRSSFWEALKTLNSQNTHGDLCVEQNIVSFNVWQHCPFFFFPPTLYLTSVETFLLSTQITCRKHFLLETCLSIKVFYNTLSVPI